MDKYQILKVFDIKKVDVLNVSIVSFIKLNFETLCVTILLKIEIV